MLFFIFIFIFICIAILYAKYPTIRNTIWYCFFFAGPSILQSCGEDSFYRYDAEDMGGAATIIFLFPIIVVIVVFVSIIIRFTISGFHNITKAIAVFIIGIVYIFVFESLTWMVDERDEYLVPECCGESHIVDYEARTYKEKLLDTYLLQRYYRKNHANKGELDFFFMIFWTIILAVISFREHEKDLQNTYEQVYTMFLVEELAGENNLNAETVQKMKNVAPSIIENMSADSRVYFDLVLDGKIPLDDPELMKSAAAIVRGHLKTHPEDKQLVTSAFGENHPILKDLAENPHFDRA